MMPFKLQLVLNRPVWLFAVLLILSIGVSLWIYRRTVPPLSRWYRILLTALRMSAMIILVFLLSEAILSISYTRSEKADVAVLVDHSESMRINDGSRSRADLVRDMLSSSGMSRFNDAYHVHYFLFGEKVVNPGPNFPDSLRFADKVTDFYGALEEIQINHMSESYSAVLVLSDGVYTKGMDPVYIAEQLGVPVYAVCIGQNVPQNDILLTRVLTNKIAYRNQEIPVHVSVRGPGYEGRKVMVAVMDKQRVLSRKEMTIPAEGFAGDVRFQLKPDSVGLHSWTVRVSGFADELISDNNSRNFIIQVLPDKQRVFLLADAPSPDLAFLKRALQTENINCTTRTIKNQSDFYEGTMPSSARLSEMDVFILLNIPGHDTPAWLWDQIQQILVNDRKPFFVIAGKRVDTDRLFTLRSCLPVDHLYNSQEYNVLPLIPSDSEYHPVVQLIGSRQESQKAWEELPPVYTSFSQVQVHDDAGILLNGLSDSPGLNSSVTPLLISRHMGAQKTAVFLGSGFYKWDLGPWGLHIKNDPARGFIHKLVRWLAIHEDNKQVLLSSDQKMVDPGENVVVSVQVYDRTYQPLNDADVGLEIRTETDRYTMDLVRIGNGLYQKEMTFFQGGRYRMKARVSRYGRMIGSDSTFFIVHEMNPELMITNTNPELMLRLAQASGGLAGPADSLDVMLAHMDFPPKQIEIEHRIIPVHHYWLLCVLLGLLGMEWMIRKRKGML